MAEDGKGERSTTSILFLAGAIGIGIWFLTVASDFADSGISPVYALFFFVPICGVFLVVVVLAEVMKSLSNSTKNNTELSGENTSSETSEREKKNDISSKQIFVILSFVAVILFVFMYSLASST
jgi:phosphate/sulfate permease